MYKPPENPAKSTDSRFEEYRSLHGESSWELDALEPAIIDGLIDKAVEKLKDKPKFKAMKAREDKEKELLQLTSDNWTEVAQFVEEI